VVLVDAPFVEGAVAAGVIAATGADLAAVRAAAEEARSAHKF
jgi:PTS hybrid protein